MDLLFLVSKFPECLKKIIVRSPSKKGDTCDMNYYIPITLIPVIKKKYV